MRDQVGLSCQAPYFLLLLAIGHLISEGVRPKFERRGRLLVTLVSANETNIHVRSPLGPPHGALLFSVLVWAQHKTIQIMHFDEPSIV